MIFRIAKNGSKRKDKKFIFWNFLTQVNNLQKNHTHYENIRIRRL